MKVKNVLRILLPVAILSLGAYYKVQDQGEDLLVKAVFQTLDRYHYSPVNMDDNYSKKAFKEYLKNLDNSKRFLLQSDYDKLKKYELQIDDQIKMGSLEFFELSNDIFESRIEATKNIYEEVLKQPFDFDKNEEVNLGDDIPYAKSEEELKERWRKYLKYSTLSRLASSLDVQEAAEENKDTSVQIVSYDSLERKARFGVLETHESWFTRMHKINRKDRLSLYLNTLTSIYDPHTNYYPPKDKEDFDIGMSGRLEGIGARLQDKDGYIQVVDIVPGGPANLQGDLDAEDLILAVGQEKEEPVDIVNWRIDDAVGLIRGKKGTHVTLKVKKIDGTIENITITRDVVVLEETYAKSTLIEDEDKHKVGYLYLPRFYTNFDGKDGRTSWVDVQNELEQLNASGAEALVFDLRGNGGGSLNDVVQMVGLFIEKGPVVQVKYQEEKPQILADENKEVQWDKPVVVMVNEFSASASEILAAALQDYGRAIIIGSQTHGKGTVQRFIGLDEVVRGSHPELGAVKLTLQKFYRINGDATQLKGVVPDIELPDNYKHIETGEKENIHSMQWDRIESLDYAKSTQSEKMQQAIKKSEKRIKGNEVFKGIDANALRWKERNEQDVFTLNLAEYRKEQKQKKEENKEFNNMFTPIEGFEIIALTEDQEAAAADSSRLKRMEDWQKSLKKDRYVYEALQVAEDL